MLNKHTELSSLKIKLIGMITALILSVCISCSIIVWISKQPVEFNQKLDTKINPNIASISSLIRLPYIGKTKAAAIVSYRNILNTNGERVFKEPDDLLKVKGIGPKTVKTVSNWLRFDG